MTKLEFALRDKKLKFTKVAKEIHMPQPILHYVINGYERISAEHRTRLAEISGLDPDELFDQIEAANIDAA